MGSPEVYGEHVTPKRPSSPPHRVEMLALGIGFTVTLSNEEAESWRVAIGKVAEDLLMNISEPNRGPHCSTCPWQTACWFGDGSGDEIVF